jgi:CubicO group peptidase (beta-lactamase class C family)
MPKAYFLCKSLVLIVLLSTIPQLSRATETQRYVFFLHNMFLELLPLDAQHPEYGRCEYNKILQRFRNEGFNVISELRPKGTDGDVYAQKVAKQVDSLLHIGVKPTDITVVGTSKGSYIAMNVSNNLKNKDINYVFIGCCGDDMARNLPELKFYGRVLSIYEKTDVLGQSCIKFKERSSDISQYKEIELNTGAKHGYLYKSLDGWMKPAIVWAKQKNSWENEPTNTIDSIINAVTEQPFNGIIIIAQDGATRYVKCNGFSDMENKKPMQLDDRFIIGSISKQMTAVLLLREYDKGRIKLEDPIKKYLPELKQKWANTVTVHQLLTHTHGIPEPNYATDSNVNNLPDTLQFVPGTKYAYSQVGFKLIADIVEKTSGRSFVDMAEELFRTCEMKQTHHPLADTFGDIAKPYYTDTDATVLPERQAMHRLMVPAGGFNSSPLDLLRWNEHLYGGKLLKPATYTLMMTQHKNALRQHPMFGPTAYGYGITVDNNEPKRLGQTGFFPGYASQDFYYPETKTSVIMLSNVVYTSDLKKRFRYHSAVLDTIANWMKK